MSLWFVGNAGSAAGPAAPGAMRAGGRALVGGGVPGLGGAAAGVPGVPADPARGVDGVGEQLVVPVVLAGALAPGVELGGGDALVQVALLLRAQGFGGRALLAVEHGLPAMGVHAATGGVEQAPFADDDRHVLADFGDHRRIGITHELVVPFGGLRAAGDLGHHQVLVGVQDHVLQLEVGEELLPLVDVEAVVEDHGLVLRQAALAAQTAVGGHVEVLEPVEFDRPGAFGHLGVDGLVTFGDVHGIPRGGGVRLVDDLDAHQGLAGAVAPGQSLQHGQHELDLVGQLRPLAHAGQAAVVEAVLAHRCGVQVDQDAQPVLLRPVERLVELLDAADERRAVAEDEVRHRDAHRAQAPRFDGGEVAFGDVFGAVGHDTGLVDGRVELGGQVVFVVGGGAVEQGRVHPLLKDEPVAQVHAVDEGVGHDCSFA